MLKSKEQRVAADPHHQRQDTHTNTSTTGEKDDGSNENGGTSQEEKCQREEKQESEDERGKNGTEYSGHAKERGGGMGVCYPLKTRGKKVDEAKWITLDAK